MVELLVAKLDGVLLAEAGAPLALSLHLACSGVQGGNLFRIGLGLSALEFFRLVPRFSVGCTFLRGTYWGCTLAVCTCTYDYGHSHVPVMLRWGIQLGKQHWGLCFLSSRCLPYCRDLHQFVSSEQLDHLP